MYLGTGADIAEFSFNDHGRIYCFKRIHCLLGSAAVLLEGQVGGVKNNGLETGCGRLNRLGGVCMICVKEDRDGDFVSECTRATI